MISRLTLQGNAHKSLEAARKFPPTKFNFMEQTPAQNVQIEASWKKMLEAEFQKPYFAAIKQFLVEAKQAGKTIYPPGPLIFNAFNKTPFDQVKVVILGQDPYHNPGEAMGLSFSVPRGVKVPPSLLNIYKEIKAELGYEAPGHGDLSHWAEQGVLMLNAMLTVEARQPASHQKIGWQTFTDAVIKCISDNKDGVVFLLWGNFAKGKKILIDTNKHYVLEAAHPSPLAGNAFQGCGHFAYTNTILSQQGQSPIDWSLPA
jgi:uracil-DNA glycosylase